jgi:hypothetical protein
VRDELAPTHGQLEQAYALVKRRGPLVVHADPDALRPRDVDALLAEGSLWLERLRMRLGVAGTADIHVFVHASADERERFTGARHVDFALPWHRQIHLAGAAVPHRSFGHELAHILAGELSDSFLKVPGRLVFLHKAAIVEGVAVAVTPELATADGLTTRELAAAMRRLGHAPDPHQLFSALGFFTENPSRAYVAAGALVESLLANTLPDPRSALHTLYRTGSLEQAAGGEAELEKLIASHQTMLEQMPLPPDAQVVAGHRFSQPSILQQTCDPDKDARAKALRLLSRTGQTRAALTQAEATGALNAETLNDLYMDAAANRDTEGLLLVAERLARIDDADAAEHQEAYGDSLWRSGRVREAHAAYLHTSVDGRPHDAARSLVAKRILSQGVLERGSRAFVASAALDVLVRTELRQPAFLALARAIGMSHDENPLVLSVGSYILARREIQQGALADGVALMTEVRTQALLPAVLMEQAALGLGTGLLRRGDADAAQRVLFDAADKAERAATRVLLRDRAERAKRAQSAPPPPAVSTPTTDPTWADRLLLGADDIGDF